MTRIKLADGSQLTVRPIEPTDRAALLEGFERLSAESRYRRFFSPMPELSPRSLDYLVGVDHHDHEALVALDADTGRGVGVARFVRTGPGAAEPAMVVADDWHGRGVANALLGALVIRAREEGILRFVAPVLANNAEALHVLERLGSTTRRAAGPEVELEIDIGPGPGPAERLLAILRQFAAGSLAPAWTLLDLLVPRRRGTFGEPLGNRIVVGVDEPEAAVTQAAGSVAALLDASVHVVGVHRLLLGESEGLRAAVEQVAGELRGAGLQVYEHVRRGDPGLVLADVAEQEGARLVVVGAGRTPQSLRRVLGSTADAVAQRAPCDVLIVRPPPMPATQAQAGADPR